jgi:hypothetical protein
VDPAGRFLVDLEDLPDGAVLAVGGKRASVLEFEAVLEDPLPRCIECRDELLRADDEDDVGGTPRQGCELTASGRGDDESSLSPVTAWTLSSAKSGWPAIAFISCAWVAKSRAIILFRIESYLPPPLTASAMPVS